MRLWTEMGAPTKFLRVAAAQMKFRATVAENLDFIAGKIADAARAKCDVILFPECALTGYNIDFSNLDRAAVDDAIDAVAAIARDERRGERSAAAFANSRSRVMAGSSLPV